MSCNITVAVAGEGVVYPCAFGRPLSWGEEQIRKRFGIKDGSIDCDGVGTDEGDLVEDGKTYSFVGGSIQCKNHDLSRFALVFCNLSLLIIAFSLFCTATLPVQIISTLVALVSLGGLEETAPAKLVPLELYTPANGAPAWLKVALPMRMAASGGSSRVDCCMPVAENPFYRHMGGANLKDLLELTDLHKHYCHALLIGCSGET
jgi:hypothetical protein